MRDRTPPVARVGLAPLPDALNVGGACEVIAVRWLVQPAALAGGFAGLAALELGAIALAPSAAGGGGKEDLTVLTLALAQWTSHWPASPQVNDRHIAAQEEEPGEENGRGSRAKKTEERDESRVLGRRRNGLTYSFTLATCVQFQDTADSGVRGSGVVPKNLGNPCHFLSSASSAGVTGLCACRHATACVSLPEFLGSLSLALILLSRSLL